MKIRTLILAFSLLPLVVFCQKTVIPGSSDINTAHLKPEKSLYTVYYVKDTSWTKMGSLAYDISFSGNQLTLIYTYTNKDKAWSKQRISIADAKTLKPISYKSDGTENKLDLNFGETIKGTYYSKKTKKNKQVNLHPKGPYIEFNLADHLITTLPLEVGYKAVIPEFYYMDNSDTLITNYIVKEVKSYVYHSPSTGNHNSWLATVVEESTGAIYNYVVDKKDYRLWQREMSMGKGMWEICVNEEIDYQPIKNRFDKQRAVQQIAKGSSVIIGTAFAKDNSGKKLGGLVNTSKKQFAPRGTEITLFPNSAYYEEWLSVNKKIKKEKKMAEVPLDPDFGFGVKKAKVYDDQGHFEFADLMPGTYVIMASFDFTNSYNYSYVSGYTNYYNYWGYTGSSTNYGSARQNYQDKAHVEKQVSIDKDGEKKEISLRE
ncbi:hypothetical protein DBR11_27045 [Pedobacter sp. HMWF019]|uniref:DUF3108 domain-containing protein n=1 Tax=Pedobacter sp. HMWF019 TaxID=2056856 RepID=UPI000D398C93|nr:hypothetical protein [Pedobacter sp. HMWF019]PTS92356.1 hypothetical protein DBR11_27045 [Pedobacter sp. HMWF019]